MPSGDRFLQSSRNNIRNLSIAILYANSQQDKYTLSNNLAHPIRTNMKTIQNL